MHTLTVWNKQSTNYDANEFVKVFGTNRIEIESEDEALRMMGSLIHNPTIDRIVFEGPKGHLTWVQHQRNESCECDCGDYLGDEDQEEFDDF